MRLVQIYDGLLEVIEQYQPDEAAVEETFVNKNPVSTLKLGQARGIALLVPARLGIPVAEYLPNLVKKTVVGSGQHLQAQMLPHISVCLAHCVKQSGSIRRASLLDGIYRCSVMSLIKR